MILHITRRNYWRVLASLALAWELGDWMLLDETLDTLTGKER